MEKKQNRRCPIGNCEKIFKAIGIGPAFRTMRSISHNPPNSDAAEAVTIKFDNSVRPGPPNEKPKSATPHAQKKQPITQTHLDHPVEKVKTKRNTITDTAQPRKTLMPSYEVAKLPSKIEPEPEPPVVSSQQRISKTSAKVDREEGNKSGLTEDNKFIDYINRAKMKIRSMSNVKDHGTKVSGGEDKSKDSFSDYINRAKLKIRSMSTFKK